jgi:protein tyrosine/serine phosphatase
MIQRFKQVTPQLFRGSAPHPLEVIELKNKFDINKIVSLDRKSGEKIAHITNKLGIDHIILPLELDNFLPSLLNFLRYDLKELLLTNGPTFVHCYAGKDRTGLAVALVECKYLGKKPEQALAEAKKLDFGKNVDPKVIKIFEKLITSCRPVSDINEADIVSNQREYIGDSKDSFLDQAHQGSFAPHIVDTRQQPIDPVYNFIMDQPQTRQNYHQPVIPGTSNNVIPQVGVYNNDAGMRGAGPTDNNGGFIYD